MASKTARTATTPAETDGSPRPDDGPQVDAQAIINRLTQRIAQLSVDVAVRDEIIAQLQQG